MTGLSALRRVVRHRAQDKDLHEWVPWVRTIVCDQFVVADLGHSASAGKVAFEGLASALRLTGGVNAEDLSSARCGSRTSPAPMFGAGSTG